MNRRYLRCTNGSDLGMSLTVFLMQAKGCRVSESAFTLNLAVLITHC